MSKFFIFLLTSLVLLVGNQAVAYSECEVKVQAAYSGDGIYWMITSAGSAHFAETIPSAKNMVATVMAAQALDRKVAIRFSGDSVQCSGFATRGDVVGIWSRSY